MTVETKPPALAGWRKLLAFALSLGTFAGLVLSGCPPLQAAGGVAMLLVPFVGANVVNARARAKGGGDGRTA